MNPVLVLPFRILIGLLRSRIWSYVKVALLSVLWKGSGQLDGLRRKPELEIQAIP
jgi:hypothetical protein